MSAATERGRLVPCECGRCKLLIDPRGGRKYAPGHKPHERGIPRS